MTRWRARMGREWETYVKQPDGGVEEVRDACFAFFQSCYHLVDWLENDHFQPIRRGPADTLIASSPHVLRVCHDLCHGSKHATLELKRVALRKEQVELTRLRLIGPSGHEADLVFSSDDMAVVRGSDAPKSAFDLADECISEWDRFLHTTG